MILTAATESHMEMAEIQRKSVERVWAAEHIIVKIHDYYPRHPSWFRIRALIDHLPFHDYILWMDTDSVMIKKPDFGVLMPRPATMYVAKDQNGLNNGIAIWRRCEEAKNILWEIYDLHYRFKDHPWHEQGAIHTIQERIDIHWIDKGLLDEYFLHLPNKSNEERIETMRAAINK